MSDIIPLKISMNAKRAEALIRKLADDSKRVRFTTHANERMEERDISLADALRVLRNGTVEGQPEPGNKPSEWKCKMVRHARGNREIGVITIIIRESYLLVKTVEWEDLK